MVARVAIDLHLSRQILDAGGLLITTRNAAFFLAKG
jgi:hypothetical protein